MHEEVAGKHRFSVLRGELRGFIAARREPNGASEAEELGGVLFEDERGKGIFEYDKPSSFFGQYGDERVTEVGRYLDATLEAVLRNAAE